MSLRLLFWMIWIITVLYALFFHWGQWGLLALPGIVFVLVTIVGWKVFGPPISDAA